MDTLDFRYNEFPASATVLYEPLTSIVYSLQLGHMRTNKKCPLYNEEGEPVAWQDSGAAADGLLERQGTKITIKRKSIPTKKMEELDSLKSVETSVVKTPPPKMEIPSSVPLLKTPSLRMKIKLSGANQNPLAPSVSKPRERIEKLHRVYPNGLGETGVSQTPRPLLKLKLSNQKQKGQGVQRLKQDEDVEAARKERQRIRDGERKEREAYEEALIEERKREEMEREERERERKDREEIQLKTKATVLRTNGAESGRGNKGENKLVFVNKMIKKKIVRAKDDPELLRRERDWEQMERMERDRERQEVEEYQRALDEELKREQEELDQKEEKERVEQEQRLRKEQVKAERERHRQYMKEKERRREQHQLHQAVVREGGVEVHRAAQEKEEKGRRAREEEQQQERERILLKNSKIKHTKERTRVVIGPTSGLSDRGKGIKRRPDGPPPSFHHTSDFGNAPKRLRKKGGEVNSSTHQYLTSFHTWSFEQCQGHVSRRRASKIQGPKTVNRLILKIVEL